MALTLDSPLRLRFSADPRSASALRMRLGLWLDELGASDEEVFEISLACNEAFANAVQHAYEPAVELVDIQASSDLKEISPEAVDVSSFDEAKRVASVAEEDWRIIEAERRRLSLDA